MGHCKIIVYLLWILSSSIVNCIIAEVSPGSTVQNKHEPQPRNNFGYQIERYSRCTAPCGGGVQTGVFVCYNMTSSLRVSQSHCRHLKSPQNYQRKCNKKPCAARWARGSWGPCSKSCGQGMVFRQVTCIDRKRKKVSPYKCLSFKPPQRIRKCGNVHCKPGFVVGIWSKCSSLCGAGRQHRNVLCKQMLANGTSITLPHSTCAGMAPASSAPCKDLSECSIQGDAPIDQEEDYDASDAFGEGSGENSGKDAPMIKLDKQKKYIFRKADTYQVNVGTSVLAVKGSTVKVKCAASGDSPQITWLRGGYPVTERRENDVRLDKDGDLLIENLGRFNEDDYLCKAKSKSGDVSTATFEIKIFLINRPYILSESTIASFGPGETDVTVTVGGTVTVFAGTTLTIKCPVVGKPTPRVYWLSQGRPIPVGQAKSVGNNLRIENVNKIYALKYSCYARNRLGVAQAFTNVRILDLSPPQIASERKSVSAPQSSSIIKITIGTNITVVAGVTLTIRCPIKTKPTPDVLWTAMGKTVIGRADPIIVAKDKSYIVIRSMKIVNTGLYGCSAENAAGKTEALSYITVMPPTKPVIQSKQGFRSSLEKDQLIVVTIGQQITGLVGIRVAINCPTQGLPTPAVTWKINQRTIRKFDQRYSIKATTLEIRNLEKYHNGQVVCTAQNRVGIATSSSVLNVISGQKPKIVSKKGRVAGIAGVEEASITIGQDLRVVQGMIFRVQCPVTGFPTPRVTWSRNDNDVQSSQRILIDKNNNDLIINGIQKGDTGQYMCTAMNTLGEARESSYVSIVGEETVSIDIGNSNLDTSNTNKPVTVKIGDSLTVLSGTDVTIQCPVTGIPAPHVFWRRKGKRTESGDGNGQLIIEKQNMILKILRVQAEFSGQYECVGTNLGGADRATSTITVVVAVPPTIGVVSRQLEKLDDLSPVLSSIGASIVMLAGARLTLSCLAKGVPRPTYNWNFNGKPVKEDERFAVIGNSLVVNQTEPSDSGRYFCTAVNVVGREQRFSNVKISAPRKPQIQGSPQKFEVQAQSSVVSDAGSTIRSIEGASLELTCNATGLPKPQVQWRFGEITVSGSILKLPKLNPGDSKEYVCEARNLAGFARKTTSLTVVAIRKPVVIKFKDSVSQLDKIKPITTIIGQTVTVIQGSVVTIVCHATGYPPPGITWKKEGVPIQNLRDKRGFSGRRLNVTHYLLTIDTKVKNKDFKGHYECSAINLGGDDNAVTSLIVRAPIRASINVTLPMESRRLIKSLSSRDPLTITISNRAQLLTKTVLTIRCPVSGLPTPQVTWYAGRRKISSGSKYLVLRGTDLVLGSGKNPSTVSDSTRYLCVVSNVLGQQRAFSSVRFIEPRLPKIVTVSGNFNFPVNTTFLLTIGGSVTAVTHSAMTILCDVSGLPVPQIVWTKDGVVVNAKGSRLNVNETKTSDSGVYECRATNLAGSRSARSEVKIEELKDKTKKPKIFRSNQTVIASQNKPVFTFVVGVNITMLEGKDLVLRCPTVGLPKPEVSWMFNKTLVIESDTLTVNSLKKTLTIKEITKEETGIYECRSKNVAGEDIAFTYAVVVGPKAPIIKSTSNTYFRLDPDLRPITINIGDSLTTLKGSRVTITCPSVGFPEPRIQWNQNGVSVTPKTSTFLNGSILILTSPGAKDSGRYTCVASNPGGLQLANSNITVLVPEPPKITIQPRNVEFLQRGKVSLRIGSNLKVLEGVTVELLCNSSGIPKPRLIWKKDRFALRWSSSRLIVRNIRVRDGGQVTCEARNYRGRDLKSTQITVIAGRKPSIKSSSKSISLVSSYVNASSNIGGSLRLLERSNVKIRCTATGIPRPTYLWSRNDEPIINGSKIFYDNATGVLDIKDVNVSDTGVFRCVAVNSFGRDQQESSLEVLAIRNPVIAVSTNFLSTTTTASISAKIGDKISALVNTTITIECPVDGFPLPMTSWTYNSLPVQGGRFNVKGSKLTITKAQLDDQGVYVCTATNPGGEITAKTGIILDAGKSPSISSSDDVIFDHSNFVQKSATIGSPISLLSGSRLKLRCPVNGLPVPTVSWKVDGRELIDGRGVVIDSVNHALTITALNRRHSNRVIMCSAVNPLGAVSASSRLTVTDPIPPKIITSSDRFEQLDNQKSVSLAIGSALRILSGTPVSLKCQAQGLPKPEITWKLANIPVTSEGQVSFDNYTLKILNMGKEYGGNYTCMATNIVGEDTASTSITVNELRGPLIDSSSKVINTIQSTSPVNIKIGSNVTALSSTNISIDCTAIGVPMPVTTFVKDGVIISQDHVIVQESKLVITKASFADSGMYTCKAKSLNGDVKISSHVTVIAGQKPLISTSQEIESHLGGFTNLTAIIGASISILSGSGIRLLCPVRGIPKPDVTWKVYSKARNSRVVFDKVMHSLTISRLRPEDFGNYICIAKNILGETMARSAVNVIEPFGPKIDSSKQSIAVLKVDVPAKVRIGARVRALSGVTISITCKVVGIPRPNITWTLNGRPLIPKNHVTVKGDSLEIINSGADDSGEYLCNASNVMGSDAAKTVLIVQSGEKARITTAGRKLSLLTGITNTSVYIADNVTILKGSHLSIFCPIEGIPAPTISFLYGGKQLKPGNRISIDLKRKVVRIRDVMVKDSGTYTCVAKNVRGEDRKSTNLNVFVPFGPTIKTSDQPIDGLKSTKSVTLTIGSSVTALVNATIIIKCEVSGLPIPKVSWTKDDKVINSKSRVTVEKNTLRIRQALLSDQGFYTCTAHSDNGFVSGLSKVTIREPIPPTIKSSNKTITSLTRKPLGIIIGETVNTLTRIEFNITCEVEGLPEPDIIWKRNGVELPADGRTFINGPIMYITGSLATDTGYYVCEAINVAGNKTVVSKLNILEPIQPQIYSTDEKKLQDLRPVTITTEVGTFIKTLETSNITLTCAATGFPEPTISWKKGVKTQEGNRNTTYTIDDAKVADSGIYTCTASNLKGFDFRTSSVSIVEPNEPMINIAPQNLSVLRLETVTSKIGKSVSTLTGNTITLNCNATGVPSPSIQWFKNNEKLANPGKSLVIQTGKRRDSGNYSCVARNVAGVTKATTSLEILDGMPPSILAINETITRTNQITYIVAKVGAVINTLQGANVEILCQVSGFPSPKITWYKGQDEVSKDPTIMVIKNETLMFVSVAQRRSGIYKCVASNPLGSASASTFLNVKGLKHPYINSSRGVIKHLDSRDHRRIYIGQDLTVLSGSNISITCPSGGIPIPTMTWKTGEDSSLPVDRFSVYGRELNVVNASLQDTGRYVCFAKNVMGQISHGSNINILDPLRPIIHKKYESLKINTRQPVQASIGSKITTIPGNKLTLTCNASGLPKPKIIWKRNDLLAQKGGSSYEVESLKTSDTGVYTCVASNLAAEVAMSSHIFVLVGSIPKIISPKVNIKATQGENDIAVDVGGNLTTIVGTGVEIHCKVQGVPRPSVTWMLNSSVVKTTSVRFVNKETNDLVLLGVTLDDVGFYTCFANNTFGQVSETTYLSVFAAKGPVIRFSKTQMEDYDRAEYTITIGDTLTTLISTTVTIVCNATGKPPPSVAWTKSGSALPKTRQFKAENNVLKIHVSSWSDTGRYECTATNAAGSDVRSSFVKFVPPEKPVINQTSTIIEIYDRKPVTMAIGSTLKTLTQTPITLLCSATGISTPVYQWSRKGMPVVPHKDFEISKDGKEITLRNVSMDDSGMYSCIASNKAGIDSAVSPILLTEPSLPMISATDENITWYDHIPVSARVGGEILALTGTKVTITCQARGFPDPTVSWRRDDEVSPLETDGQYKLVNDSLVIFAVQPSDSGRYRCIARNLAGNVQSQTKLKVIDPEKPEVLISSKVIRTEDRVPVTANIGDRIVVLSGTTVYIQCPVKGIPLPKVVWSNGGKFLQPKDIKRTLVLSNTSSVDSGEYTCTAVSPIDGDSASSTIMFIDPVKPIIQASPISKSIQISNKPVVNITVSDSVTVFVGTTVVVKCQALGLPKPKIRWEKAGKELTATSADNTLAFKTSTVSDSSTLTCVAENSEGSARGSSTIKVIEKFAPRINSKSGMINSLDTAQLTSATIGQMIKTLTMTSIVLKCPATGSPIPDITWSLEGSLISTGERIRVDKSGNLIIQKSRISDSGDYMCTARSVVGLDSALSTIIIMSPTRPEVLSSTGYIIWYEQRPFKSKIGNNLTTMKGRKLTLTCPARGMPRPEITWYRGGEKMTSEANIVIKGDTLIISDLSVFDTDRYTCVAQNYVGGDAATTTLKVYDPVVPRILPSSGFIDALSGNSPVNVKVGQDVVAPVKSIVKLMCPYNGVPRPRVLWIKDHVAVTSDETIEVDCNGTIKFHGIRASDAGEFVCYVENYLGIDLALSRIKLVERSVPVIQKSNNIVPLTDKSKVIATIGDNVTALQTQTIVIKCNATGIPYPVITWTRNGVQIKSVGMYSIDKEGTLTIIGARTDDLYRCLATNDQGSDSGTTELTIKDPKHPEILSLRDPKSIPLTNNMNMTINVRDNVTALPGSNITIKCHVTGVPDPIVTWLKDDNITLTGNGDNSLTIPDVSESDIGLYTCKADNVRGTATAKTHVEIIKPTKPRLVIPSRPDSIPSLIIGNVIATIGDNVTALTGSNVTVHCPALGSPPPKWIWSKDGKKITPGSKYEILNNGTLLIRIITLDESGVYRCSVENIAGKVDSITRILSKAPKEPKINRTTKPTTISSKNTKPVNISVGSNLTALVNTTIRIICMAIGLPLPILRWEKDGKAIMFSEDYKIGEDGSLVIENAKIDDSGLYTCQVENIKGQDKETSTVDVIKPVKPRIRRPRVSSIQSMEMIQHIQTGVGTQITTLTNTTILLDCIATGVPEPRISWRKDSERIDSVEFYRILANNSLIIDKSELLDDGVYTCEASNDFGRDELSSDVKIIEPEIPIIQKSEGIVDKEDFEEIKVNIGHHIKTLSSVNITVNCSARGVPAPRVEWMNGGKMLDVIGPLLILGNVDESLTGKYTCIATNVAGNVSASTIIHIREPFTPVIDKTHKELVANDVTSLSSNIGGSVETLVGSNLLLLCNTIGYPAPQVKWFSDGNPVRNGGKYVVSDRSLRVFGLQLSDSSNITCTSTNIVGEDSATTEIVVKGLLKPTISVVKTTIRNFNKSQPISVNVGAKLITGPGSVVVISCPVLARPKATLSWQLKGVGLTPSKKYRLNADRSKLTIVGVEFADAGAYVCTAFNRVGTDFARMDMTVATPPVIVNVRGSFDVADIRELISIRTGAVVTIPRGVSIRIKCETTGFPTPNITWFRIPDGATVRQPLGRFSKGTIVDQDGFLLIERANELDIAQYICVATNIAGRNESVTSLNIGVVPQLPGQWSATRKFTRPRIERIKSMATVIRGSVVRLRCAVYGSPKPRISWIVVGNQRKDHWRIQPDGTLEIPKVDFSDEGNYTCIATNSYGRTFRSTNITVLVPAKILDKFFSESVIQSKTKQLNIKYSTITRLAITRQNTRSAAVERGRNLVIGCSVMGKPEPKILWLRNGLKVLNDSKHWISGGLLVLRSISPADAGEYFCFVTNTAGEDGGGVDLQIRDKIVGRWLKNPWSECKNCYANFKGFKTRAVNCIDDKNNIVPESYCAAFPRPSIQQNCRARSCEAIWVTKPWSSCSALCGSKGTRGRSVRCVFYRSLLPAGDNCPGQKPEKSQPCNRWPCGQRQCEDLVNYCRQIKARGLCTAFKQYCCSTCGGQTAVVRRNRR